MALHAQARQLARHGRIRTRRSRVAMSGSPHRRQANPRPRSHRMAGPPQQAPRQSRLAIHNRQRPRQAKETVPSVRVTRATRNGRSSKIEVLDANGEAVLATLEGEALARILRLTGAGKGTALPAGGSCVLFIDVTLPDDAMIPSSP